MDDPWVTWGTPLAFIALAMIPVTILVWTAISVFRARGMRRAERYRREVRDALDPTSEDRDTDGRTEHWTLR